MGQETELDTIGILRMQKRERLASLVSTDVIILWISKHGTRQMNARSLAQLAPLFANVKNDDVIFLRSTTICFIGGEGGGE